MSSDTIIRRREKDRHRKILAGAAALHKADNDSKFKERLLHLLDGFLESDDDRALFGLPPYRQTPEQETEKPAEQ